jgi:hypothetical protein
MKVSYLIIILFLFLSNRVFSQERYSGSEETSTVFSVGMALGSEHNIGHWGLFISNDLKVKINEYLALNPRINYFETLAATESGPMEGYSSHSGIFIDFGVSYYFIRESDYAFSLNVGHSYQIGNQTYSSASSWMGDELIDETFEHTRIRRFGFYTDLEYSWNREGKCLHTVALKTYSFEIYPEFLGLGYKIGFKL